MFSSEENYIYYYLAEYYNTKGLKTYISTIQISYNENYISVQKHNIKSNKYQ